MGWLHPTTLYNTVTAMGQPVTDLLLAVPGLHGPKPVTRSCLLTPPCYKNNRLPGAAAAPQHSVTQCCRSIRLCFIVFCPSTVFVQPELSMLRSPHCSCLYCAFPCDLASSPEIFCSPLQPQHSAHTQCPVSVGLPASMVACCL